MSHACDERGHKVSGRICTQILWKSDPPFYVHQLFHNGDVDAEEA